MLKAAGHQLEIRLDGDSVTIALPSNPAKPAAGTDQAVLPLRSISRVTLKEPSGWSFGYIRLDTDAASNKTLIHEGADPYKVVFDKAHLAQFREMKGAIEKAIHDGTFAAPSSPLSVADEIRKLAGMKDEGLISDEEFESKRTNLLGY